MAAAVDKSGSNEFVLPPRKKPKVSELPLSSAKRASIDSLLHTFKKKGDFDSIRKKTYAKFEDTTRSTLVQSLQNFVDTEIERDPVKYLAKDRRLAAPLLEGAAARADVYPATEADIDRYISSYLAEAEATLREIRRKEIGDEAAMEEQEKGARSDEAYAADAEVRRKERAKRYAEQMKIQRKKEKEAEKKAVIEALKAKEAELIKFKERIERENKRRAEREALKKREEERKKEKLKQLEEERERKKKEREAEEKRLEEERAARKKREEEEEHKRLEAEAERLLLRESARMVEKSARRDRDRDRSEEVAPPSHREFAPDKRGGPTRDSRDSRKDYRPRSPTPERDRYSSRREERGRPVYYDEREDRAIRHERANATRESTLRAISAERNAWLAKQRELKAAAAAAGKTEEKPKPKAPSTRDAGSVRARSKSPIRSKRHEKSRSPPPRSDKYRDSRARSRTRSPPRRSYRERDYSPPRRRRSRSRSPGDRYIPSSGRRRDDDRDRDYDRYSTRDRERDRDRDDRDRRRTRDYDEPSNKEIDRYIPSNSRLAERGETSMGPSARSEHSRRDRSQSRSRLHESSSRASAKPRPAPPKVVAPIEPPAPKLQFANLKWRPDNAK